MTKTWISGLAGVLLLAGSAAAQVNCAPADQVTQGLTHRYGEVPALSGVTVTGELMQLWLSPTGKTWTVTVTNQVGVCIISAGRSLERVAAAPKDQPS
jgi:hypothetical protein